MISLEVEGSEEVKKYIKRISDKINSDDLKRYIGQRAIEIINEIAFNELSESNEYIKHNKIQTTENGVMIYNDVQNSDGKYYSLIIEFGSGVYAQMQNIGQTQMFKKSGKVFWYVPEEKATRLSGYNYERVVTNEGNVLYKVYGQYPNYIYTDSIPKIKYNLKKWISEYLLGM